MHALPGESTTIGETIQPAPSGSDVVATTPELPRVPASVDDSPADVHDTSLVQSVQQLVADRQQAIQAGFLIDVSADAQKLGFTFSVTVTKPLWEFGIAPGHELSEQDKAARLRDVLMAFRLRLAGHATISPLIDFPAMLALPPGSVPQPVPLFALIQPDEQNRATATLLLPNEVSTTIIPAN